MRMPLIVLGVILLAAGGLIAAGVFKFETTEKVADLGPIEINKTETKAPPVNVGWLLLGAGALSLVVGVATRK